MNSKRYDKHLLKKRTPCRQSVNTYIVRRHPEGQTRIIAYLLQLLQQIRTEVEISEYILKQFLKEIMKCGCKFLHNVMDMVTNITINVQ